MHDSYSSFISQTDRVFIIEFWFIESWCVFVRCAGVTLSSLLGRKGSLEKMQDYWDVGFYLGAGILANEHKKVIEASEKLYRLNAPVWWVTEVNVFHFI